MAQIFTQTVPRHAGWLLVGPPAATSLAPQQDITVTFADGTSVVVPASTPAALLGGGTTWDRTKEVVVGYVLKTAGTLLAAPESQLATISTDYAPLVRVLADGVQVYQTQQAGGGASLAVDHAGVLVGTRPTLNLIDGTGVTLTVADNGVSNRVDVTVASTGGGGSTTTPAVSASSTADITIPNLSLTRVPLNTTEYDQGTTTAQHSNTVSNTQLVCQVAGLYHITAWCSWTSALDTALRNLQVQLNGSVTIVERQDRANYDGGYNQLLSIDYALIVGDYLELCAFQQSGASTTLLGTTGFGGYEGPTPRLSMFRFG